MTNASQVHRNPTITPHLGVDDPAAALDFYRRMVNDRSVTPPGLEEIDSVKSGELFASGAGAMMVNWFGFAAVCEQPGCPVKGKTGVTTLPSAEGFPPASLIVYWLLSVAAGSPHPETAAIPSYSRRRRSRYARRSVFARADPPRLASRPARHHRCTRRWRSRAA